MFCSKLLTRGVAFSSLIAACSGAEMQRPNFLWLTIEDSSPYQFGCYGNPLTPTPALDELAREGVRFTNAVSCAPHCSAARSTLITGALATTYGMDFHRAAFETPEDIFYPRYFRENGYYCVNNKKTHYNSTAFRTAQEWNEQSTGATYASPRKTKEQPFFAVFNFGGTHMSRTRSITLDKRRDLSGLGIVPEQLKLPPHVPDLPETRSDQAKMLETVIDCDAWVKAFIDDLKQKGQYDDTIIFFFSDHGGNLPRGKGYPFESGLKVPLLIRVPPKWQEKFGIAPGSMDDRLVGFEDLASTALSMAEIKLPEHMQGQALYGRYRSEPKRIQFGFRTNQEQNHYDPCRTASDGH